jgi:transcriptional regulator of NAD metabolism
LFTEHKQTNYFLLIKGNVTPELRNEIVKNIYTIVNVLTVHHIPLSTIKNVENFFSDLELDMMEMLKEKTFTPPAQPKSK